MTTSYLRKKLSEESPIFSKSKVNYSPTHPILFFRASDSRIALLQGDKTLERIDQQSGTTDHIDLSSLLSPFKVHNAFLDYTGKTLLLSLKPDKGTETSECLLICDNKGLKPKFLSKAKGELVTAVEWPKRGKGPILIGTARGSIIETEFDAKGSERYWRQLADFGGQQRIAGISYNRVPHSSKYFILISTNSRLYQLQGLISEEEEKKPPVFLSLFNRYNDSAFKFVEFSSTSKLTRNSPSLMDFFFFPDSNSDRQKAGVPLYPKNFAWMSDAGVYTGEIDPLRSTEEDCVTVDASLIPFPDTSSMSGNSGKLTITPKWFVLTEFHGVLGYDDIVKVVCLLDQRVVFEDRVDDAHGRGKLNGLTRDPITGILYSYSDYSVVKYKVKSEERNVWKIYLSKGLFEEAKRSLLDSDPHHSLKMDEILRSQAEHCFKNKRYLESAVTFSKTSASFEEVALRFANVKDKTALLNYLKKKIETIRLSETTQLTMVVIWVIEIYLNQVNDLKDVFKEEEKTEEKNDGKDLRVEDSATRTLENLNQEFKTFINTSKISGTISENRNTIYELLSSHGDTENLIMFACLMKDYDRAVKYKMQNGDYTSALTIIDNHNLISSFYIYGSTLLRVIPEEFVRSLMRLVHRIDPTQMIPCFIAVTEEVPIPFIKKIIINYLEYVTEEVKSRDQIVHNYLLSLYAENFIEKVNPYLHQYGTEKEDIPYDIKYALKVCSEKGLHSDVVFLFCILGELEYAVDLSLKEVGIDEAREVLKFAKDDEDLQKKIWLKIARHVVQEKNDIKSAMDFLEQTTLVKIEDILPFFNDFVTIDHFKDAICQSLHDYSQHIATLKAEMEEANNSAEKIRSEIHEFKNRYCFVRTEDVCSACSECLLSRPFHLFTCGHKFHTDCLIERVTEHLSSARRRKVEQLQFDISKPESTSKDLFSEDIPASESLSIDSKSPRISKKDQLLSELDDLVASECLFCGDIMVRMIDQPFFEDEDYDKVMMEWF